MLMKAIVMAILAAIFIPILRLLWGMGFGRHLHKHYPGKCRAIKRPGIGSEDFQIMSTGLTFVTTNIMLPQFSIAFNSHSKDNGKGSIQILDLNIRPMEARALPIKHGKDFDRDAFRPHGLGVLEDKVKGEHLVYVVNHAENQTDRVEKFRFSPKTQELIHVKSIHSDLFRVTNDLTVLSEDRLYITNWLYFKTEFMSLLEQIYQPHLGAVLFYNGTGFTSVLGRLSDPNGIILSKDQRYMYLIEPMKTLVTVYKRRSDVELELVQEVNVHTGLDNFHLSETGDSLYAGCNPVGHKEVMSLTYPAHYKSYSQVLRLPLKDGLIVEEDITEEFLDSGQLISASSIAGLYKNKMLIGSVVDSLVVCDLPKQ